MELGKWRDGVKTVIGKYKYALLVLFLGITLMMIPGKQSMAPGISSGSEAEEQKVPELSAELSTMLSEIQGAGKVKVLLSVAQGEKTIYQTDTTLSQNSSNTDSRTQTILITDSQRNEMGLIHQKNPPIYQGAIVLSQGADSPSVILALVDAVAKITGLGTDRISVLKMK